MSKKYAVTQIFKVNPSPLFVKCFLAIYVIALLAAFFNALPIIYRIMTFIALIIHGVIQLKRINKTFMIRHNAITGWEMVDVNSPHVYAITVLPSTVISYYLIVLHFNKDNKKQTALICHDALTADDYRKLKVALRISGLSQGMTD